MYIYLYLLIALVHFSPSLCSAMNLVVRVFIYLFHSFSLPCFLYCLIRFLLSLCSFFICVSLFVCPSFFICAFCLDFFLLVCGFLFIIWGFTRWAKYSMQLCLASLYTMSLARTATILSLRGTQRSCEGESRSRCFTMRAQSLPSAKE